MPWWQVLLILSVVVFIISLVYSIRVARFVERGKERDEGVGSKAVKHKILTNPVFWTYIGVTIISIAAIIYFVFIYPEGAHRGSAP